MLEQIARYFQENMDTYLLMVRQHVGISVLSLAMACVVGIPFGYLGAKVPKGEKWITGAFQVLRIIPSLALLILLIPIMGTGVKPAMTALVVLAVPPILLNTMVGLRDVPDFMMETARGIGMAESQVFWRVQLPLALPMIFTGIKTAMVEIVASATLASKIGAGGLGDMIFTGLGLNRTDMLLIGGISVAVLSLLSGFLLEKMGEAVTKYKTVSQS